MRVPADRGDGLQHFRRGRARFQTALCRKLVDQTIGQRVAERHAEFENIHPDQVQGERKPPSGFEGRVARADVNHQSLFARLLQPGKPFHDAIHAVASSRSEFPVARFKWVSIGAQDKILRRKRTTIYPFSC